MTERRQGENWAKRNFFAMVGLALMVIGWIIFASRWSARMEEKVDGAVTKPEFTRLETKVESMQDRLQQMDCKLNDGCVGRTPPSYYEVPDQGPARAPDRSRSGVNHP